MNGAHPLRDDDDAIASRADGEWCGVRQDLPQPASRQFDVPPCDVCGGPHPFDTSVPSVRWNAVFRANNLPEYLCLTCIVREFATRGDSFTAELIGGPFPGGCPIEVRVRGAVALDATIIGEQNTALRWRIRELEEAAGRAVHETIVRLSPWSHHHRNCDGLTEDATNCGCGLQAALLEVDPQ